MEEEEVEEEVEEQAEVPAGKPQAAAKPPSPEEIKARAKETVKRLVAVESNKYVAN